MHSLLLISIGVVSLNALLYSLKAFLLKWLLRLILGDRVQFDSSQSIQTNCHEKLNGYHHHEANGVAANGVCNGHSKSDGTVPQRIILSKGDVAEISQLIVGQVVGVASSVASIIIMWQTRMDVIHSKSWILVPFSHLFAWYFLIDLVAMLESFTLRKNLTDINLMRRLNMFARKKWPHLIHHLLIFFVAYPLTVNYSLRGNRGDFILGVLMAEDLSTPLVSFAKILKMLNFESTTLYKVNGLILIPIFFVARILNIPLAFLLYAAQYHSWDIWAAAKAMTFVCHFFNTVQWLLQFYWFTAIIGILTNTVRTYFKVKLT